MCYKTSMPRLLLLLLLAGCSRREPPPPAPPAPVRTAQEPERRYGRAARSAFTPEGPVRRGPYVQAAEPTKALLCFETVEEVGGGVLVEGRRFTSPPSRRHAIPVDGLKPATRYDYVISPGGLQGSFKTPPEGDGEVSFTVWGDSRTFIDRLAKIAALAAADRPDFSVHSGDLVDDGDVEEDWDLFFKGARPLLAAGSFWPAMGNHETGSKIYTDLFHLPEPERWYTFRWGPAQFFILDSNYDVRDSAAQADWLKRELAASKSRFKFVMTHYPVVSGSYAGFDFGEEGREFAGWRSLFEEHRVTAVLQGHNHNYQRHERKGIVYITSGGAGAPLYSLGEGGPERKAAFMVNHYVRVRLKGRVCAFEAVDIEGKVIDRREIEAGN